MNGCLSQATARVFQENRFPDKYRDREEAEERGGSAIKRAEEGGKDLGD